MEGVARGVLAGGELRQQGVAAGYGHCTVAGRASRYARLCFAGCVSQLLLEQEDHLFTCMQRGKPAREGLNAETPAFVYTQPGIPER